MPIEFEIITVGHPRSHEQWHVLTAEAPRSRYPWTTREDRELLGCRHSEQVGEFALREGRTFEAVYNRWRQSVRAGQALGESAPWIELDRSEAQTL